MAACPWSSYLPSTINFCEQRLCAWVVEPAGTSSNIAYLICAVMIGRHARSGGMKFFNFYSLTGIFLFLGSSFFHGTGIFVGELTDLMAMFFLSASGLSLNLQRLLRWTDRRTFYVFWAIVIGSVGLMLIFKPYGIEIFALEFGASLLIEGFIFRENRMTSKTDYKHLRTALIIFALAYGVWLTDYFRLLCWPDNHIFTGHSLWHVLTAVAIYYFFKFYMPFLPRRTQTNG